MGEDLLGCLEPMFLLLSKTQIEMSHVMLSPVYAKTNVQISCTNPQVDKHIYFALPSSF